MDKMKVVSRQTSTSKLRRRSVVVESIKYWTRTKQFSSYASVLLIVILTVLMFAPLSRQAMHTPDKVEACHEITCWFVGNFTSSQMDEALSLQKDWVQEEVKSLKRKTKEPRR